MNAAVDPMLAPVRSSLSRMGTAIMGRKYNRNVPPRYHGLSLLCLVAGYLPGVLGSVDRPTSRYFRLAGLLLCVVVELWASVRYSDASRDL
jgi:hypothetical protein